MRDHAAARVLRPTPVVCLAPSPQNSPEIAACALVIPHHPVDPFVAKRETALDLQLEAELLRTPALCPQLAGDSATDTAHQFLRG